MKKLLALLIAMVMLLTLAACGDKPETPEAPDEPGTSQAPEVASLAKGTLTNKAGSYEVRLVATEIFDDENGEKALRVYIDFENKTADYSTSYEAQTSEVVTQNGEELDIAYAPYEIELDEVEHYDSNARPGHTVRLVREYELLAETGVVNFKLTGTNENSNEVDIFAFDIDLAKVTGAPEALQVKTVADPKWNEGWAASGDLYDGKCTVSNITSELVDGKDGGKVLRVYFDFTNKDEDDKYINRMADVNAYQDGVEILEGRAAASVPEESAYERSVPAGETVKVAVVYELKSESPVEFEVYDIYGSGDSTGVAAVFPAK